MRRQPLPGFSACGLTGRPRGARSEAGIGPADGEDVEQAGDRRHFHPGRHAFDSDARRTASRFLRPALSGRAGGAQPSRPIRKNTPVAPRAAACPSSTGMPSALIRSQLFTRRRISDSATAVAPESVTSCSRPASTWSRNATSRT
ncbi:MAG: hypothetical protein MZV70_15980 [Desulfobacterales bacterium]|nr:hypothetical protein [Desulfobacterales bacterium]